MPLSFIFYIAAMIHSRSQLPPNMFNLEGTFLGFLDPTLGQPKSILMEIEEEEIAIDLPHRLPRQGSGFLWQQLQKLQPGDRVHCIGRSHINLQAGVVQLRAYQLLSPIFTPLT